MVIQIAQVVQVISFNKLKKAKCMQFICISFLLISCGRTSQNMQLNDSIKSSIKNDNWIKLPIEVKKELIFGILDTGATISVVNSSLIESIDATKIPLIKLKVNNQKWCKMFLIKEIIIGGKVFKNVTVVAMDLSHLNIDFIIGMDLIKKYNWEINFKNDSVEIHQLTKEYHNYNQLHYKKKKQPILDVSINNENIQLIFDTGRANSHINLKKKASTDSTSLVLQSDALSEFESKVHYEQAKVIFGKDTLSNQVIRYDSSTPSLIGLDFIRQYDEMIVLPSKKMLLFK